MLPTLLERMQDVNEVHVVSVFEVEEESDWPMDMIKYCQSGVLPTDPKKRVYVRRTAPLYTYLSDTLYKMSFDGILLRCFSKEEGAEALKEGHAGIYGAHQAVQN